MHNYHTSVMVTNHIIIMEHSENFSKDDVIIMYLTYVNLKHNTWLFSVVVTTRQNGTCDMLTLAKLSVDYLVVGITRELDKEPSLHCYPIYISYKWSILQQCVYLMSTPQ